MFTPDQDEQLKQAVVEYGENYRQIKKYLNNAFTVAQIKERLAELQPKTPVVSKTIRQLKQEKTAEKTLPASVAKLHPIKETIDKLEKATKKQDKPKSPVKSNVKDRVARLKAAAEKKPLPAPKDIPRVNILERALKFDESAFAVQKLNVTPARKAALRAKRVSSRLRPQASPKKSPVKKTPAKRKPVSDEESESDQEAEEQAASPKKAETPKEKVKSPKQTPAVKATPKPSARKARAVNDKETPKETPVRRTRLNPVTPDVAAPVLGKRSPTSAEEPKQKRRKVQLDLEPVMHSPVKAPEDLDDDEIPKEYQGFLMSVYYRLKKTLGF